MSFSKRIIDVYDNDEDNDINENDDDDELIKLIDGDLFNKDEIIKASKEFRQNNRTKNQAINPRSSEENKKHIKEYFFSKLDLIEKKYCHSDAEKDQEEEEEEEGSISDDDDDDGNVIDFRTFDFDIDKSNSLPKRSETKKSLSPVPQMTSSPFLNSPMKKRRVPMKKKSQCLIDEDFINENEEQLPSPIGSENSDHHQLDDQESKNQSPKNQENRAKSLSIPCHSTNLLSENRPVTLVKSNQPSQMVSNETWETVQHLSSKKFMTMVVQSTNQYQICMERNFQHISSTSSSTTSTLSKYIDRHINRLSWRDLKYQHECLQKTLNAILHHEDNNHLHHEPNQIILVLTEKVLETLGPEILNHFVSNSLSMNNHLPIIRFDSQMEPTLELITSSSKLLKYQIQQQIESKHLTFDMIHLSRILFEHVLKHYLCCGRHLLFSQQQN